MSIQSQKCEHGVYLGQEGNCTVCCQAVAQDVTGKDCEAWERKLHAEGLTLRQSDNTSDRDAIDEAEVAYVNDADPDLHNEDFYAACRARGIDGSEVPGFHEVGKQRVYDRNVPEWAMSDAKVKQVISSYFRKALTDAHQTARAAKWAAVTYRYFRLNQSAAQIALDLSMTCKAVEHLIATLRKRGDSLFTTAE